MNPQVYKNILKLYNNASNDNKSHILSMVDYDELKKYLKEKGFKFTKKKFENAKNKKNSNEFTLKKYKRHIPESKKKINDQYINNIKNYLNKYSRIYDENEDSIKYLEQTKKFIYKRYSDDENNRKITYNTFIKNIPKNYKYSKRRTDMCGICSIGENLHKIDKNKLNDKEKEELKEQIELYENHLKVVQNQKDQYNKLKNNLVFVSQQKY